MKNIRTAMAILIPVFVTFLCLADGRAEDTLNINQTDISGHALSQASGVIGVNQAAGDNNAQVNARAIVLGDGAPGIAFTDVYQQVQSCSLEEAGYSSNYIGGNALTGVRGIVGINQAAGSGTTEANLVAIGIGIDAMVEAENLLMVTPLQGGEVPEDSERRRSDVIEGHAFKGSSGLVQVNQSAGSANRIANTLAIEIQIVDIP